MKPTIIRRNLPSSRGINLHKEVDFIIDGKAMHVHSNEDVDGPKWYFTNGEGCRTIWFETAEEAALFLFYHGYKTGTDSGLCKQCNCHYSFGTKEYKKYPQHACGAWKEKMPKKGGKLCKTRI